MNVGVAYRDLLEDWQPLPEKCSTADAQIRERIGLLMPNPYDVWWTISERGTMNSAELRNQVVEAIRNYAIPFVLRYLDIKNLLELWRKGLSPGLTGKQRIEMLCRLEIALESKLPF